jgi:hypothetical protein
MKVTRLDGSLLDFWVAKSEGLKLLLERPQDTDEDVIGNGFWHPEIYRPSSNWIQGGPIVSNEWYELETVLNEWFGLGWPYIKAIKDEPLKWLMRAYVATKFGEVVEEIEEMEFPRSQGSEVPQMQPLANNRRWPLWFGGSVRGGIRGY